MNIQLISLNFETTFVLRLTWLEMTRSKRHRRDPNKNNWWVWWPKRGKNIPPQSFPPNQCEWLWSSIRCFPSLYYRQVPFRSMHSAILEWLNKSDRRLISHGFVICTIYKSYYFVCVRPVLWWMRTFFRLLKSFPSSWSSTLAQLKRCKSFRRSPWWSPIVQMHLVLKRKKSPLSAIGKSCADCMNTLDLAVSDERQ